MTDNPTPTDGLSPDAKRLLAGIARKQLAKLLSSALDAADLLATVDDAADPERAERDEMVRASIEATIVLL